MMELIFRETTIRNRNVSFAADLDLALAFGFKIDGGAGRKFFPKGWHDLTIYLGPLSLIFTVYGRGA